MHIVIVGAGDLGSHLASALSEEGKNVTVIDKSSSALEKFVKSADVAAIVGSGTNWQVLEKLLENKPDYFISITGSDETNLIACNLAKSLGYPKTIARISSQEFLEASYLDFGRLFFVDHFLGPKAIVANDLFKNIINPLAVETNIFSHGAIQMQTFLIGEDWQKSSMTIKEMNLGDKLLIGLIRRKVSEKKDEIIFPGGGHNLYSGDEVTIIGETSAMLGLSSFFGVAKKKVSAVVITGARDITVQLSKILHDHHIDVYIIERNEKTCELLSSQIPFATIFNHDEKDLDFLVGERLFEKDAFIACYHSVEDNILATTLAQEAGCKNVITMVPDITYSHLFRRLNITYAFSEKLSVTNQILSILHGEDVISITSLYENRVKIVEFKMSSNSKIVGIPLSDLRSFLPKESLIALIENRGRVMVGKGSRILSPGDTVIAITTPRSIKQLEELF
ncbi:MAG: Trk system potassium transporter TrkA [Simkaniaceae bacterium]